MIDAPSFCRIGISQAIHSVMLRDRWLVLEYDVLVAGNVNVPFALGCVLSSIGSEEACCREVYFRFVVRYSAGTTGTRYSTCDDYNGTVHTSTPEYLSVLLGVQVLIIPFQANSPCPTFLSHSGL